MSASILQDDRVLWIRQKVALAFEISPSAFDNKMEDPMARGQLMEYLSSKCGSGSAIFFAANSWAEDIEGKVFSCAQKFPQHK